MSAPIQTESRLHHARSLLRRELRPTLRLALPLVIAEIGWMGMTIVDTIMVGRLPNSAVALGGVSLGSGLYYTVAIFGSGLLLGLDTVVSHAFGRRDLIDAAWPARDGPPAWRARTWRWSCGSRCCASSEIIRSASACAWNSRACAIC